MLLAALALVVLAAGCGGGQAPARPADETIEPSGEVDSYLVGKPQTRSGIGDVDLAFARYEVTRAEMIDLFRSQPWFKDGLSRDESLFVERALTFVARYDGPRRAYVSETTIRDKLYLYEKVKAGGGEVEVLLIYEPGQNAEAQMRMIKLLIPTLERLVGVEYPERVMTIINGNFEINDYNEGQFIRIARCCVLSAFVLAHELAHTYWSMASSWFNEGMADIYAIMALERLNAESPAGWSRQPANLDEFYRSRRALVDRGRFPEMPLTRRLASDGLYEAADVFLLDIRRVIGEAAFAAAAREIYLTSDFGRYILREKRIQDLFLKHTPEGRRDEVMALFNQAVWGDNGERYRELQEREAS